jgi:Heterokaryon incompatibility protein (HET)
MRLICVDDFQLEEYFGKNIPEYTILSHRWGHEEATFSDISTDMKRAKRKLGFKKVERCAKQTKKDGYRYCWVDTCCIDKTSSAELTEAINSMYKWYQNSQFCYAYLDDVPEIPSADEGLSYLTRPWEKRFSASKWWTRGWTLQELIAPRSVVFYSENWDRIGTKREHRGLISSFTGIHIEILYDGDVKSVCVAQRMSWASRRETTREEDIAYCLMGIFDVNMPLLYGEGEKAFLRLQEAIINTTDDHSIFAWTAQFRNLPRPSCSLPIRVPKLLVSNSIPRRVGGAVFDYESRIENYTSGR